MLTEICSVMSLTLSVVMAVLYHHTDNIFAHITLSVGCVLTSACAFGLLFRSIMNMTRNTIVREVDTPHQSTAEYKRTHFIDEDEDEDDGHSICHSCYMDNIINLFTNTYDSVRLVKVTDDMLTLPDLNVCYADTEIGTVVNFFKRQYELSYNKMCTISVDDIVLSIVIDGVNYLLLLDHNIHIRLGYLSARDFPEEDDSDSDYE